MSRARLEKLEASGKFLFHGSARGDLGLLAPRQAKSYGEPDGEPAVFASSRIDPPIFMALLGSRNDRGVSGWSTRIVPDTKFGFYCDQSRWSRARKEDRHGFIYVLPRDHFEVRRGWEWRSFIAAKPTEVIRVELQDLPADIQIFSDEEAWKIHSEGRSNLPR